MPAQLPSVEEQIERVKGWIADLVKRLATVDERRTRAWLEALRAYRSALQQITPLVRWVSRSILYSRIVAAEAPWAPQPQVTPPQVTLAYPLRTRHPDLGEIPYVQSLKLELATIDLRYQDVIAAIVEGNWKLIYAGEEHRPTTTGFFTACTSPDVWGKGYVCIGEALDATHKCMKFFVGHECAVYSASVAIPEEACDIDVIVLEGRDVLVACKSDNCCAPETTDLDSLTRPGDYDWLLEVPTARVWVQNNCTGDALLVTPYANVSVPPRYGVNIVIAQVRGMRDTCSMRMEIPQV